MCERTPVFGNLFPPILKSRHYRATQEENYILAEGGVLIDRVESAELPDAAEFLFEQLVQRQGATEQRAEDSSAVVRP